MELFPIGKLNNGKTGFSLGTNAAGAVGSLILGTVQGLGVKEGILNAFGESDWYNAATIAAGGLSGGLSSTIAGGNFWMGARQGLIVSGLNHVGHNVIKRIKYNSFVSKIDKSIIDQGLNPNDPVEDTSLKATAKFIFSLDVIQEILNYHPFSMEVTFLDPFGKEGSYTDGVPGVANARVKILKMGKAPERNQKNILNGVSFNQHSISIYDSAFSSFRNLALGVGYGLTYTSIMYNMSWQYIQDKIKYEYKELDNQALKIASKWYEMITK